MVLSELKETWDQELGTETSKLSKPRCKIVFIISHEKFDLIVCIINCLE